MYRGQLHESHEMSHTRPLTFDLPQQSGQPSEACQTSQQMTATHKQEAPDTATFYKATYRW